MSDRDVDAQFADIIAHWDDVAQLPQRGVDAPQTNAPQTDPPQTDPTQTSDLPPSDRSDDDALPPAVDAPGEVTGDGGATPRPGVVNPSPLNPAVNPPPALGGIPVWRGATPAPDREEAAEKGASDEDDEEHFEPGPTAPLPPQEDIHFWGIVVGLVAGPLLLLWLVIFRPDVSDWWVLGALGLTVGGFILLVLRQPSSRDDDDPDNGARV